jgi:phage shock protein A
MGEIEKYKDMSKVSNIYKSLEKTIKSLESIVDKIEDKKDLMDSINEDTNPELKTKDKDYKVIFDANEQVYKVYYKGSLLVKKHNKKDILSYLD